jgi:hypothetical protein
MMIIYKSRFLTRGDVWFDDEPGDTRSVDWILYHQRSRPVPGTKTSFFYTYIVDLTQPPEQLLANMNKDNAYKIRRARERDKIVCESCDPRDPAVMDHFEQMNNAYAAMTGRMPLNRAQTESLAAAGALDLTVAKDPQGKVLVYHSDYRDHHRARALHLPRLHRKDSGSAERNYIGRANRYLTWSNILRYQEQGLKWFDFGGWHEGNDPEYLKVNDFKRGFGGQIVREYHCEQILTLKGWVVLTAANLLRGVKLFTSRPKKPAANSQPGLTQGRIPVPAD